MTTLGLDVLELDPTLGVNLDRIVEREICETSVALGHVYDDPLPLASGMDPYELVLSRHSH